MNRFIHAVSHLLLFSTLFVSALFAAWIMLAKIDFLYPVNYRLISIDENIATFGPKNTFKRGFETTNTSEHQRLFGRINRAIFSNGEGLNTLYYKSPEGQVIDSLLTPAEVIHLKDVSKLVSTVNYVGVISLLLLFLLTITVFLTGKKPKSILRLHLYGMGALLVLVITVMLIGAEKVFYKAHTWVFPKDHQWFFYYEESLMTTLMKAPDLFALIAVEILVLTLLVYTASVFALMYSLFRR